MHTVRIVLFANEDHEYIVIITDDANPEEHKEPGYVIVSQVYLDIDASLFNLFPTDRPLRSVD